MHVKKFKNQIGKASVIASFILLVGCSSQTIESQIVGRWSMTKVLQHDNDVTAEHNPEGERWIEFRADKTFLSGGAPFGENTGSWSLKEGGKILFLDSSVENDDSEWDLHIMGDEMQWTGIGDPGKEAFTLIHSRM